MSIFLHPKQALTEKSLLKVDFGNKEQWNEQFDWIIDTMLKMKRAFKKYL